MLCLNVGECKPLRAGCHRRRRHPRRRHRARRHPPRLPEPPPGAQRAAAVLQQAAVVRRGDGGQPQGVAVQVDPIKPRDESALGFNA
jgi:hypothetical protein